MAKVKRVSPMLAVHGLVIGIVAPLKAAKLTAGRVADIDEVAVCGVTIAVCGATVVAAVVVTVGVVVCMAFGAGVECERPMVKTF